MRTQWTIIIHSAAGYPCGAVTTNTKAATVAEACEHMPWLSRAKVKRMARKENETMKTALAYITKIPPEATSDQEVADAIGACLRAENIPYAFAQRDEAGNCLTCGGCELCPGIHTFEEIIDASQNGIPPPLTGWTAAQLPKTPRYARSRIFAAALEMFEALQATVLPLQRLGDFVGDIDKGGASGLGEIDRCAILGKVRAAIALAKGEYHAL